MPNFVNSSADGPLPYIPVFTSDRLGDFWQYVQAIGYVVMPIVIIFVATYYGGQLIGVLRDTFSRRKTRDDEDYDDDYDRD
jgi:hypothetical protein